MTDTPKGAPAPTVETLVDTLRQAADALTAQQEEVARIEAQILNRYGQVFPGYAWPGPESALGQLTAEILALRKALEKMTQGNWFERLVADICRGNRFRRTDDD